MNIIPMSFDLSKYKDKLENMNVFEEHVFSAKGRAKLKKIDEIWGKIKEELVKATVDDGKNFNPIKFYKNELFHQLELTIQDIFGFRYVEIIPHPEKAYSKSKDKMFVYVNAYTSMYPNRFAIDGIITDAGFFDKSKSMQMFMTVGLPLIQMLEPEELTAVFLHEMGHNLDPSTYNINYKDMNDYVKYLLDTDINKKKKEQNSSIKKTWLEKLITLSTNNVETMKKSSKGFIAKAIKKSLNFIDNIIFSLNKFLATLKFKNPFNSNLDKVIDKLVTATKQNIKEKGVFSKFNSSEAFADNFPRMYGYDKYLITSSKKIDKENDEDLMKAIYGKDVFNRANIEKIRSQFFAIVIQDTINDVHKTDIHRYYSLLKEYYKDLKDKTIPAEIKKSIQKDLDGMIKLGDVYFKSPDQVKNKIYASIFNAIKEVDPEAVAEMPDAPKENHELSSFLKMVK